MKIYVDKAKLQEFTTKLTAKFKTVFALKGETATDEQVTTAVSNWLNDNVDPVGSAVVVDSTLLIEGAAADAKATGDAIGEVEDEVSGLKTQLNDGLIVIDGYYINGSSWAADNRARTILIPVTYGDMVAVKATSVGTDSRVGFIKNVQLPIAAGATVTYSSEIGYDSIITLTKNTDRIIAAPTDAEYIQAYLGLKVSSPAYNRTPQRLCINGYDYIKSIAENLKNVCNKAEGIEDLNSKIGDLNLLQWYKGRYNNGVWLTDSNNSAFLKVEAGDSYKIQSALNGNSPIAALKNVTLPPVDGQSIICSDASGWTEVIFPSNGEIIEGTIPSDTNYLYFYFGNDQLTRMPNKIMINGFDVKKSIVQSVADNASGIDALESVNKSEFPIFAKEKNIRSYGHGGYAVTYPFNSLMGYRDAKRHGFNWAETDVQFTSDNIPVLCHDDGLYIYARNPDGTRVGTSLSDTVLISEITYNELLYYDFGLAKSESLAGMKITTFEQLMQSAQRMNLSIAIEIKRTKTPTNSQIDILFDLIDKYHMRKNVNFCSAVRESLTYIYEKDPAMELTYIVDSITSSAIAFVESIRGYNPVAIAADVSITDAMVSLAKQAEITVNIGPINNDTEILNANPYITHFTSNGPIAEEVMNNYELSQL